MRRTIMKGIKVLYCALVGASVRALATCDYAPIPYVDTCYDSAALSDPCAGCNAVAEFGKLNYDAYSHDGFLALPSGTACEPALNWVCPENDRGLCCVQQANFSVQEPYRKLCARMQNELNHSIPREDIDLWTNGSALPMNQSFGYGSKLAMEVSWDIGPSWSLGFLDAEGQVVFGVQFVRTDQENVAILQTALDYASLRDIIIQGREWLSVSVTHDAFDV